MEQRLIRSATLAVDDLVRLAKAGESRLWVDYDKEVDVLYISFREPQKADDAYEEDGIVYRKRRGRIIGLTVLDASRFLKRES